MLIYLWLPLVFVLGAAAGSFLNVCIARLPLEKSVLWPGSRCGHCLQPVAWYDNLPLISYWRLRGRCRTCGATFSMRYFVVELLTGLGFAALFHLEVIVNVHHLKVIEAHRWWMARGVLPWQAWAVFGHHAVLFGFLMVAAFCDLDSREVPLGLTLCGAAVGLLAATLWPWPWPYTPADAAVRGLAGKPWWQPAVHPVEGLYPWPFWGPLPDDFQPGGNWQTGLATGLVGLLAGTLILRAVRFVFTTGLGKEALGLGDADLMMMAGAFLGWQPMVVSFFMGVFVGLFFGLAQMVLRGDNTLPFVPALALGTVITWLSWHWIGPRVQLLFFNGTILVSLAAVGCVFMLISSYLLRLLRLMRP